MNPILKHLLVASVFSCGLAAAQNPPITLAHQVTHSDNEDPTFSPDGKRMIYISVVAGKEQLFAMDMDGKNPTQLTRDDADHEDPAWSPDGKKVAFVLIAGGKEQIHLMNPDGTGVEALTPAELRTIHPSWTPDSKKVAYCTDDDLKPPKKNDSDIYLIDVASRQNQKLVSGGVNTFPVCSPDGGKIAFRRMVGETNSEVFVANADGREQRNITNNPAFDGWPAWSPDGKKIAFASNRGNTNYQIYMMNADGSDVRRVAPSEGRATSPKWSKDGKTIYFTNCQKADFTFNCEIYAAKLDAYESH
jgi:TolB protein